METLKKSNLPEICLHEEEPFIELWRFVHFNVNSKFTIWLRRLCALTIVLSLGWFLLAFILSPYQDLVMWAILLIAMPAYPGVLLQAINTYSIITSTRDSFIKDLNEVREIVNLKDNDDCKNYKKQLCRILICLTLVITLTLFLFHPAFIQCEAIGYFHFEELPRYYKIITHLSGWIILPIVAYFQSSTLVSLYYSVSIPCILHYKLMDYIDGNLCKNYKCMDIVDSDPDQAMISAYLQKCALMHFKLRRFIYSCTKLQNIIILAYCPLMAMCYVVALYFIFENKNKEVTYRMYFVIICYTITAIASCHVSQQASDAFEEIHNKLCTSTWHYWNKENRKLLLILLPNTVQKVDISLLGLVALDYPLLLRGVKLCYSLLTMAINLTH